MRLDRRITGLFAAAILAIVALAALSPARAHGGPHPGTHSLAASRDHAAHHAAHHAPAGSWTRLAPIVAVDAVRSASVVRASVLAARGTSLDPLEAGCCPAGCRNACCGVACAAAGILPQAGLDLPPPTARALRPHRDAAMRAAACPERLPEPPRRGA